MRSPLRTISNCCQWTKRTTTSIALAFEDKCTSAFFCISVKALDIKACQVAQWKASFCNAGASGSALGRKDPLEKEVATHSSILAWKIHGQRGQVGCSPWSHTRVRHDLATKQEIGY